MTDEVTAIVLTLNEEEHLPECLESLAALTTKVIVLDSGSIDQTVEIARAAGSRIELRTFDGFANQRNAALQLTDLSDWICFIDADERLTQRGANEIRRAIRRANGRYSVLQIPRKNVFFGHTLRGGGWWPDHQPRVIRRGYARYDERNQVHEHLRSDSRRRNLSEPLIHLNYATWTEFNAKQRMYSKVIASDWLKRKSAPPRQQYVSAPLREFFRRFIRLNGYRDGLVGFRLAIAMAREELWIRWSIRHAGCNR